MRIEMICSEDALVNLTPEWANLYERSPNAAPFQHPQWVLPWWRCFGSGKLLCFGLWDGGRLAALAPFFCHPWEGRRQVTIVGNGVSDRLGVLAESDHDPSWVIEGLENTQREWDVCDLQDLPEASPLCAKTPTGLCRWLHTQYTCSYIPLPESMEAYLQLLSHVRRRNTRRSHAQLASCGELRCETAGSEPEFQAALEQLFALHKARWESEGQDGMLNADTIPFHRLAAGGMWRAGKARCFTLSVDGKTIAVIYGFLDKGRFWSYQSGFDPAWARFSPGCLILQYAISEAIREGASVFDFLRGEEAYKSEWGARFEPSYRLMLWKNDTFRPTVHPLSAEPFQL